MATSIRNSLTSAMQLGWQAGSDRSLINSDGKPFDYGDDFFGYCSGIGLSPAEAYAFQGGYFAALYRGEYYPANMHDDMQS